jgi:hypothetical protein
MGRPFTKLTNDGESAQDRLVAAQFKLEEAEKLVKILRERRDEAMINAIDCGVPVTRVGTAAGMSRTFAYRIINKHKESLA